MMRRIGNQPMANIATSGTAFIPLSGSRNAKSLCNNQKEVRFSVNFTQIKFGNMGWDRTKSNKLLTQSYVRYNQPLL
jgi:hypothetical protein